MNKNTAGAALAVAIGCSALAAVPAAAATGDAMVFADCATAAGYGVYNIPVGSAGYSAGLADDDGDGVVCESAEWAYDPTRIPVEVAPGEYRHTVIDWIPGAGPGPDAQPGVVPGADPYTQVGEVPVGGADTGADTGSAVGGNSGTRGPVLGSGLVLAAAGAAVALRRRATGRA